MNQLKYTFYTVLLLAASCGPANAPTHLVWQVDGIGEFVYYTENDSPGFTADISKLLTLKSKGVVRKFNIIRTGGCFRRIELWVSSDRSVIWLTGRFLHNREEILAAYSVRDDVFLDYNTIFDSVLADTKQKYSLRSRLICGDIKGIKIQRKAQGQL